MKPFNLELAKAGHPVCTRKGKNARIVCFDRRDDLYPIIALTTGISGEDLYTYTLDGRCHCNEESGIDLMMKSKEKEGWVNIYQDGTETWAGCDIFSTKEKAIQCPTLLGGHLIDTIKIQWEE